MLKLVLYIILLAGAVLTATVLPVPGFVAVGMIMLLCGFFILINGADYLVDGCCSLADKMKLPPLMIGLTVIAAGTSVPELSVSVSAALAGSDSLALSTLTGSDIFNLLLVLGLCAAIKPITTNDNAAKRDFPVSVGASAVFLIFILDGRLNTAESVLLLAMAVAYMSVSVISARKSIKGSTSEEEITDFSAPRCAAGILGGLAGVIIGGALVASATKMVSLNLGINGTLAGLTICAAGTGLPELVTSIAAARHGENDMAVGNILGSNIINILAIPGIAGVLAPLTAKPFAVADVIILTAVSIIAYIWYLTGRKMSRAEGIALICMYVAYMAYIVIRSVA